MQRPFSQRLRLVARQRRARPSFGKTMGDLPDATIPPHGDAPFFRALGDVAFEAGEPHVPQGRGQGVADKRAIRARTRLAPDERVPQPLGRILERGPRNRHANPIRTEHDATVGKRALRGRHGRITVDGNGRHVGAQGREREPRGESRDSEQRQARAAEAPRKVQSSRGWQRARRPRAAAAPATRHCAGLRAGSSTGPPARNAARRRRGAPAPPRSPVRAARRPRARR